jgi:hypothetical protein
VIPKCAEALGMEPRERCCVGPPSRDLGGRARERFATGFQQTAGEPLGGAAFVGSKGSLVAPHSGREVGVVLGDELFVRLCVAPMSKAGRR